MATFKPLERISSWRRIAAATWDTPTSPAVLGFDDIDMSGILALIGELREATGAHVTVTHIVVKAVAEILARHPDLNVVLIRGRPMQRTSTDIFVQVAVPRSKAGEADLSGIKLTDVDTKSLVAIAEELSGRARRVRAGQDKEVEEAKRAMDRMPAVLLKHVIRTLSAMSFDLGLDLSSIGLKPDPFGAAMVTNVGGFGVNTGFAPLVPFARTPIVLLLGRTEDRPVVRKGKVVARPIMRIAATFDHRLFDGYQIGLLSREIRELLEAPEPLAGELLAASKRTVH